MTRGKIAIAIASLALAACGSDGSDGLNYLVDVSDEAAGSNCAAGGSLIETGPDTNGDGVLDPSEVTESSYVCNDEPPPPPADQLVSIDAEAAGANCEFGGVAISQGVDTDGSGTLDSGEITSTSYICDQESIADAFGDVIPGSVTVTDFLDLVVVAQFAEVQGDLIIEPSAVEGVTSLDLGHLQVVEGDFTITDANDATSLDLSSLTTVGGNFALNGAAELLAVDLPSLTTVDGNFGLQGIGMAASISAPALTSVTGNFAIADAGVATSVDFGALTTVDDFNLNGVGNAATVNFSALTTVVDGDFDIIGGSSLGNLDLSALTNIGETYEVGVTTNTGDFTVSGSSVVGDINLSALTNLGDELKIEGGATIGTLDLSALPQVPDDIEFQDGATLGAVNLSALTLVGDWFYVEDVDIVSLDISTLATVSNGTFRFDNITTITTVSAPLLVDVEDLEIIDTSLQTVSFALLETINDSDLWIEDNTALTSASFPALTTVGNGSGTDDFLIINNDLLTTIDFSSMDMVDAGSFTITGNATLTCAVIEPIAQAVFDGNGAGAGYDLTANSPGDCTDPS